MAKVTLTNLAEEDTNFAEVGGFYMDIVVSDNPIYILHRCYNQYGKRLYTLTSLNTGVAYHTFDGVDINGVFGEDKSDFRKLKPGESFTVEIE